MAEPLHIRYSALLGRRVRDDGDRERGRVTDLVCVREDGELVVRWLLVRGPQTRGWPLDLFDPERSQRIDARRIVDIDDDAIRLSGS